MKAALLIANTALFGRPWGTSNIARVVREVADDTRSVRLPMLGIGGFYPKVFVRVAVTGDTSVFREEAAA